MDVQFLLNPYLIAIFSVLVTIFILKRKEKLDGLRSLNYEINENNKLMTWNVKTLMSDITLVNNEKELFPVTLALLSKSSFEHNKHLGNIERFSEGLKNLTSNYYGEINITNRQIEGRENLKFNLEDQEFCKKILIIDMVLMLKHFSLMTSEEIYKINLKKYKELFSLLQSEMSEENETLIVEEMRKIIKRIILRHPDSKWGEKERIESFNLSLEIKHYNSFEMNLLINLLKSEISKYKLLDKIT